MTWEGGGGWSEGLARSAVVLTGDRFDDAKTAHGLLRRSPLFDVVAIVDVARAGTSSRDTIPDGIDVPVVASVAEAPGDPAVAIVGVATYGGGIPPLVRGHLAEALAMGLDVVSGLHEPIADDPALAALIATHGNRVVELRAPKPFRAQRFWTGQIAEVTVPRIAVLGTDCDIGKRTTMFRLVSVLEERGVGVEVVATGQTGLLQGARQGFVLDATPLDFISGELESGIIAAASHRPDVILIQSQGSFRGPTGQVGPQLLVHTGVTHAIVQHSPTRQTYKTTDVPMLGPEGDIALIQAYGAVPLAITLNTTGVADADREAVAAGIERATGVEAIWPDPAGIDRLADLVAQVIDGTEPSAPRHPAI